MNRRQFISLSGAAGLAAVTPATTAHAADSGSDRDYYEVRQYIIEKEEQRKRLDDFFKNAAIPALNRLGVKPVGVFYPGAAAAGQTKPLGPFYVVMRHPSAEVAATLVERLGADSEFQSAGADYLDATASSPAYKRIESSLLVAFNGMPRMERPVQGPGRVFQLRTYESPSEKTNFKKIEMFDQAGEIQIFREVGLNPVFFGRALVGTKLPNLTYMLGFKSPEDQQAAWKKFGAHPEWKRLKEMQEYADKNILCGITNISLVPAEYSQM
jgi:hypothetical protein